MNSNLQYSPKRKKLDNSMYVYYGRKKQEKIIENLIPNSSNYKPEVSITIRENCEIRDTLQLEQKCVEKHMEQSKKMLIKKIKIRPSFTDQLAAISMKAGDLTLDIRKKAGLFNENDGRIMPLFTVPTHCITIGTLSCRYPSPVEFYPDRFQYVFHHPYEASEVHMTIYFKDMIATAILGNKLQFRILRHMIHFTADFDHTNQHHYLVLEFASQSALLSLKKLINPSLKKNSFPS